MPRHLSSKESRRNSKEKRHRFRRKLREVEDFFEYLNMKQASIETLSDMNAYIEEELKKVEQLIDSIKVTKGA